MAGSQPDTLRRIDEAIVAVGHGATRDEIVRGLFRVVHDVAGDRADDRIAVSIFAARTRSARSGV